MASDNSSNSLHDPGNQRYRPTSDTHLHKVLRIGPRMAAHGSAHGSGEQYDALARIGVTWVYQQHPLEHCNLQVWRNYPLSALGSGGGDLLVIRSP